MTYEEVYGVKLSSDIKNRLSIKSYKKLVREMKSDPDIDASGRIIHTNTIMKPFKNPYSIKRAEISKRIEERVNNLNDRQLQRLQDLGKIDSFFMEEQMWIDQCDVKVLCCKDNKYFFKEIDTNGIIDSVKRQVKNRVKTIIDSDTEKNYLVKEKSWIKKYILDREKEDICV